jgi:bacterioferritin
MKRMINTELIEDLNRALSYELAATIQYTQHSFLITGVEREVYRKFFRDQAEEAHEHTYAVGDKIVALGGVPTVEPAMIQQAVELKEMLRQDLELERAALAAYMTAWESAANHKPTQFWLEERIAEEQLHVEELEKLCRERIASLQQERITLRQIS